ncbi:hypothetical protein B0H13DRAFT_1853274 [Mycena leptocephala]|nr:hypothetical protein B0H13DRAFT_1853274 [Mycena leptocephala]
MCFPGVILIAASQTVKQNKNDCTQLLEMVHQLMVAIVAVHIDSDTTGELPPTMLNQIGKFTETLHKIHTFVEGQQDGSRIKKFFRQGEMSGLLKDCYAGLQEALDFLKIEGLNLVTHVKAIQEQAQIRHQEVLYLIESLSNVASSDKGSSVWINPALSGSQASLNSFAMLPSEPKIFHGRESEVSDILKAFFQGTPRVAILGPGGMGKTALARTILDHPHITAKYEQHCFFVACDTGTSKVDLDAIIGAHLGLKPGSDLTRAIMQHFENSPPCLLISDNLETVWEPTELRKEIEEFLSLLTDIQYLTLIAYIDKVLLLTDNMPLAIDLIAHLVNSEGCAEVLPLGGRKNIHYLRRL